MKILFNTYHQTPFYGINETVNKIKSQINGTRLPLGDSFTPAQESKTVIIENYYENSGDKADFKRIKDGRGGAAVEGAVSGTTTGTAIEGTKSVAHKIKSKNEDIEHKPDDPIDADDSTSTNLIEDNDDVDDVDDIDDIDDVDDIDDIDDVDDVDDIDDIDDVDDVDDIDDIGGLDDIELPEIDDIDVLDAI